MKIYSNNAAGLNQPYKLHNCLRNARCFDISFFQETKLTSDNVVTIRAKWGPNVFLSCAATSRRGTMTLIHPRVDPKIIHEFKDDRGQFHVLIVSIRSESFLLVNCYIDPDTDVNAESTMKKISDIMDNAKDLFNISHTIMGGDFNFVMRNEDTNSSTRKPRALAVMTTIEQSHDLYDIAALQSPAPRHTYFRHHMEQCSARYDRFHVSPGLLQNAEYRLLPRTSDHAPISFSWDQIKEAKDWKFSDHLLTNPQYMQGLHNTLRDVLSGYADSSSSLEEMQHNICFNFHRSHHIFEKLIKAVRDYSIKFSRVLNMKRREKEETLLNNLMAARAAFNSSQTAVNANALEAAQQALVVSQTRRADNASTMNTLNYCTNGERMSRYHFQRAGNHKASRDIVKLIVNEVGGPASISRELIPSFMFDKYKQIIKKNPMAGTMSIQSFLGQQLTESLRKCPDSFKPALVSPVLHIEIKNVLAGLKVNSAPGPTGISNNITKEIAKYTMNLLAQMGNDIFFNEDLPALPAFFFHRKVVFILKPGKNHSDPDSYRGLSLLETFFKLFSKILTDRLQRPLKFLQSPHQFGFTKGVGCLEASRTVLDVIAHAKRNNKALIVLSTDFKKAFDSIHLDHIEQALKIYGLPQPFIQAYMRMARNGTLQYEVNSVVSEDMSIEAGTGQGDPKSAGAFNIAVAPLNHYLCESPDVPRYRTNQEISPVFFADDDLLLLDGSNINLIVDLINKILTFQFVSGLTLNPSKCSFLAINCNHRDTDLLADVTGMQKVTSLKHLGLVINEDGMLRHEDNIAPIVRKMFSIADSLSTNLSTPIGRALYSKFLLSSRYIHRIQNFHFSEPQLKELRKAVLQLTWTRHRPGSDNSSARVHIAADRVSQPPSMGGLGVPHPSVQAQALSFTWVRKINPANSNQGWYQLLDHNLHNAGCPGFATHIKLGAMEWTLSSRRIKPISPFWSQTFSNIANFIKLAHKYSNMWHLTPIAGHEDSDEYVTIGSLFYRNPAVRNLIEAGLVTVGQLFHTNNLGFIDFRRRKSFDQLQTEFGTPVPFPVRLTLTALVNKLISKPGNRSIMVRPENITTLQSLLRVHRSGCNVATRLLLQQERENWPWGEVPRSYFTYTRDNLMGLTARQFSASFARTRKLLVSPPSIWTSTSILLRTLWTNVKESSTIRNRMAADPVNPSCSNCGTLPEHTEHLMYSCPLALQMWTQFNEDLVRSGISPITISRDNILFNHQIGGNERTSDEIVSFIITAKHTILKMKYRHNRDSIPSPRLLAVMIIIDIEKLIQVRSYNQCDSPTLLKVMNRMKERVGF